MRSDDGTEFNVELHIQYILDNNNPLWVQSPLHPYTPIAAGFGSARILSTSTTKSKHEESSHGPRTLLVGLHVGDEVGVELPLLLGRQIAASSRVRGRSGKMRWLGFACRVRGAGAGPRERNASGWKTGRGTLGRACLGWERAGRGPWTRRREEGGPRRRIVKDSAAGIFSQMKNGKPR